MKIYVTIRNGKWILVTTSHTVASRIWGMFKELGGVKFISIGRIDDVIPAVYVLEKIPVEFSEYYVALASNHPIMREIEEWL